MATHPVGHHGGLGVDVGETRGLQAHLGPFNGLVQLGRSRQPVPDAVAEPSEIRIGTVGPEGLDPQPLGGGAEGLRRGLGAQSGGDKAEEQEAA